MCQKQCPRTKQHCQEMLKNDLNDGSNLVVNKYVDIGIATKSILNKSKVSEKEKMDFQVECRHMCVTCGTKVDREKCTKYKVTRASTALNPSLILSNRILSERRMTEFILILYEVGRLRGASGDRAKAQFTSLWLKHRKILNLGMHAKTVLTNFITRC